MTQRLDMHEQIPGFYKAMVALEHEAKNSSIETGLFHLMKLRASQLNHCAFCTNMHTEEALHDGVDPRKIYLLTVWEESWLFSDRERAALAWTESVTLIAETGVPDEDYEAVREVFSEKEVAERAGIICAINVWNRLAVSSRQPHK